MSLLAQAQWAQQVQEQRYTGNSTVSVTRRPIFRVSSELTPVVQYEDDPWLFGALEELRTLKQAGVNIPALGDFRITEETMDHVRRLLTTEAVQSLEKPHFVPFSGGGISLVWNFNNRELTFSVYPGEEEVTFMTGEANDAAQDDGVVSANNNPELTAIIRNFLSNAAR